jgi:hypothetical protein
MRMFRSIRTTVALAFVLGLCWDTGNRITVPAGVALAQTTTPTAPSPGTTPAVQAPIGHRQPRATDVPPDRDRKADEREAEEQRRLDRVLRGICRGC